MELRLPQGEEKGRAVLQRWRTAVQEMLDMFQKNYHIEDPDQARLQDDLSKFQAACSNLGVPQDRIIFIYLLGIDRTLQQMEDIINGPEEDESSTS